MQSHYGLARKIRADCERNAGFNGEEGLRAVLPDGDHRKAETLHMDRDVNVLRNPPVRKRLLTRVCACYDARLTEQDFG
jgi:hypothetical protein